MSDLATSLIRTYVPLAVGALLSWFATKGVELDDTTKAQLIAGLTSLISAIYYTVIRILEGRWPKIGVLLGSQKTPKY